MDNPFIIIPFLGSAATGFALYQLIPQLIQLNKKYIQFELINEFTPTSLMNYFHQTQKTTVEAFVAGELNTDNPINSKYPLIISQKKIYYVYEKGIKKLIKPISQVASQFCISDYYNKIEIWRNSELSYQNSLSHIWDKFKPQQLSIIQRLINFILKSINQFKTQKLFFKGFYIGLLEREYGIIAKEFYVLYGEIILDKKLNKMFLQNPRYILKSKKQLLELIIEKIKYQKITIALLVILFSICTYIFGCNIKNFIFKILKEREKARLDKLRGQKYLEINNYECQICYERPRNIIIKPCKHLTICHECLQRLKQPKCPICKQQIEDQIEIFFT